MRIELRIFAKGKPEEIRHLILIPENESESQDIDFVVGDKNFPIKIIGEITLADGYGQHYIRIEKEK